MTATAEREAQIRAREEQIERQVRLDAERVQLTEELLGAVRGWRDAKRRFVARTAHYERRYGAGTVEAEFQARDDYQRKAAVVDTDFYQREVQTIAAALTALGGAS